MLLASPSGVPKGVASLFGLLARKVRYECRKRRPGYFRATTSRMARRSDLGMSDERRRAADQNSKQDDRAKEVQGEGSLVSRVVEARAIARFKPELPFGPIFDKLSFFSVPITALVIENIGGLLQGIESLFSP
jgi:hypothetical protein